ncbi:MAG TPA: hypothetical protein VMY39_04540 [Planctomycetota bacterium]|nr:hypothetical protein [Planctomycetota bacterium]
MRHIRMMLWTLGVCLVPSVLSGPGAQAEALAPLTGEERVALVGFARQVLAGSVRAVEVATPTGRVMTPAPEALRDVPPALRRRHNEEVFVRIFRDRAPTIRFGSRRDSLAEAVFAAMIKARTLPSYEFYDFGDVENVGLVFERVVDRHPVAPNQWFAQLPFIELGVHGVSLEHGERRGVLPPGEALMDELTTRDEFIGTLCTELSLYPKWPRIRTPETLLWDRDKTRVEILSFETFLSRGAAYPVVELYRMNDLNVRPWKDRLSAAALMGDRLISQQADDGQFFSRYDAREGLYHYENYSIIDHGYAIITLCDLYAATREQRYLDGAGKAVLYLKKQFRSETRGGQPYVYVVHDGEAKLGAAALAVVALDRYAGLTGAVFHDVDMQLLGRFLVRQQYDDGSFRHYYRYDAKVSYQYRVSPSFPGQAAWALAVLERRTRSKEDRETWRKSGRLAVDYLITKREKEMKWTEPPADVWLTAALHEMGTLFPEKPWLDYAKRMSNHALAQQLVTDCPPDVVGSFRGEREGSVRGAAVRVRLLGEIAEFTMHDDRERQKTLEVCRRAMQFIRFNQLRPNNAFYLPEPQRVYGMVRTTPFYNDVRLDTTCHVIEAILWLDRREKGK